MRTNVLHLIPSFHQGGSEKQALQLAGLQLEDASDNVFLASLSSEGILRGMAESAGFGEVPEFPLNSFYDRNAVRQAIKFARHLGEKKIEILQTHDYYSNVFGMFAGAFARVPVRIAAKRETEMRSAAQNFVERNAFRLAHLVVANSFGVRDFLAASGVPGEKIEVIHNGIDTRRFELPANKRSGILESFNLPSGLRRIVTIVANLREKVKNYPMFIEAAAQTLKTVDDVAFVAAGEGCLLENIERLSVELGLSDRMFFLGRCSRVPELLSVSDVCVLTSFSEGFSNSILEYMAAGKPVVATDVGGLREAIVEGETGYLVPSGDSAAMAERFVRLLKNEKLARTMGEKGRERVKEEFSLQRQFTRTREIYQRRKVPVR